MQDKSNSKKKLSILALIKLQNWIRVYLTDIYQFYNKKKLNQNLSKFNFQLKSFTYLLKLDITGKVICIVIPSIGIMSAHATRAPPAFSACRTNDRPITAKHVIDINEYLVCSHVVVFLSKNPKFIKFKKKCTSELAHEREINIGIKSPPLPYVIFAQFLRLVS